MMGSLFHYFVHVVSTALDMTLPKKETEKKTAAAVLCKCSQSDHSSSKKKVKENWNTVHHLLLSFKCNSLLFIEQLNNLSWCAAFRL